MSGRNAELRGRTVAWANFVGRSLCQASDFIRSITF